MFLDPLQITLRPLNWAFLNDMLLALGFTEQFVGLIMECMSITSYSIMLNGASYGFFRGGKWPMPRWLSVPLFIHVMCRILSRRLSYTATNFSFHPRCSKHKITNFCFVDDLILLCQAYIPSFRHMKIVLEEFNKVSGLCPNLEKSEILVEKVSR